MAVLTLTKETITLFSCPFSVTLSHSFVYLLYFCPNWDRS